MVQKASRKKIVTADCGQRTKRASICVDSAIRISANPNIFGTGEWLQRPNEHSAPPTIRLPIVA